MNLGVIYTSAAHGGACTLVAERLKAVIEHERVGAESALVDLAGLSLPIYDPAHAEDVKRQHPGLFEGFRRCHGLLLITPEGAGMASLSVNNLLMYFNAGEVAHKPGLRVTVVDTSRHTYQSAEVRSGSFTSALVNWVPLHLVFRIDTTRAGAPLDGTDQDESTLRAFLKYCKAMAVVRPQILDLMRERAAAG